MTPPAAAAAPSTRRSLRAGASVGVPRSGPAPRRLSGRARVPLPATRRGRPAAAQAGLLPGLLALVERLSRHRLLDRLIAGRAWIALVAFALIGIVTLQLGLLELNSSVGRALEREGALQRENAALAIENSELAAGERVESLASKLDMQLAPTATLRFLTARPGVDAGRAAAALSAAAKAPAASSHEEVAATPSSHQEAAATTGSHEEAAATTGSHEEAAVVGSPGGETATPGTPGAEQASASAGGGQAAG